MFILWKSLNIARNNHDNHDNEKEDIVNVFTTHMIIGSSE